MDYYSIIGLILVIGLLLTCLSRIADVDERVKALENRADGSSDPLAKLGDLRDPAPEALRQALDPSRGMRNPDA